MPEEVNEEASFFVTHSSRQHVVNPTDCDRRVLA